VTVCDLFASATCYSGATAGFGQKLSLGFASKLDIILKKTKNFGIEDRITALSDAIHAQLKAYVYLLIDPRNDEVFYVGKGNRSRLLAHEKEARNSVRETKKLTRIRAIEKCGREVTLKLHRTGMTDDQALEVEGALIDVYTNSLNAVTGKHNNSRGAMLLKEFVQIHNAKKAKIQEPTILININKEWNRGLVEHPSELMERTSRYWVCRPEKRHNPKHVFAIALGIIRGVYSLKRWRYVDMASVEISARRTGTKGKRGKTDVRCEFLLEPEPSMQHFVGQSVSHLQTRGAQNPVKYINC
jgi:hypothetical protein